jgi:hypothetical protein
MAPSCQLHTRKQKKYAKLSRKEQKQFLGYKLRESEMCSWFSNLLES